MEIKRQEHLSTTRSEEDKKVWKKHKFKIIYSERCTSFDSFKSYEEYLVKNKQDIEKDILEWDKEEKGRRYEK